MLRYTGDGECFSWAIDQAICTPDYRLGAASKNRPQGVDQILQYFVTYTITMCPWKLDSTVLNRLDI